MVLALRSVGVVIIYVYIYVSLKRRLAPVELRPGRARPIATGSLTAILYVSYGLYVHCSALSRG